MDLRSTQTVAKRGNKSGGYAAKNETLEDANVVTEMSMAAPPPPYSPPQSRTSLPASESTVFSSADGSYSLHSSANPSRVNTPTSTAGALSPSLRNVPSARNSIISPANSQIARSGMQIPPPPPRAVDRRMLPAGRGRPLSVSALSQVVSYSQPYVQGQLERPGYDGPDSLQPPAAKRAVSAGAVSNGSSSIASRDPSESGSSRRGWPVGVALPGPPPGPLPASSRSQCASGAVGSTQPVLTNVARHSQAYRVPLRAPLLSPMPPTPADWTEDQPMHYSARSPVPLQIRTTNLDHAGSLSSQLGQVEAAHGSGMDPNASHQLTRSSAVRESSVKGLRERRSLRKSISDPEAATIASLVVETKPWSASIRPNDMVVSQGQLSDSHVRMGMDNDLAGNGEEERPSTSRSTSFARSFKPSRMTSDVVLDETRSSRSPVLRIHKLQTGANMPHQGHRALPTPPLSQKAPASAQSVLPSSTASLPDFEWDDIDAFAGESLRRHKTFLEKERRANSGEEKLQVLADYLVAESVLRLQHYSGARQVDILQIRQRLFDENDSAVVQALQAKRDAEHAASETKSRPEKMWWKDYQPALSPIASMGNDEMSSRGRASSRWWESQTGSHGGVGQVRRTKRESKYMGLSSTGLIDSMIEENHTPTNFPSSTELLSPDEYPQEKANPAALGLYDDQTHLEGRNSAGLMDVSRFITLPPPFPRHYPAVNNSHPQLANYRLTVRSLSDLSEVKTRKSRQQISLEALRNEHRQKRSEARRIFKNNIQMQIAEGSISYAEAAEAEAALREEEKQAEKEALQAEFDTLQDVVINPLHDMLNDRLMQLNSSIKDLSAKIQSDAQDYNPDRPQQEGDDTPELLEYLTQLKWLFETRETLHKELFELLTERNDKYKEIVILPYRQANNGDKVRETEMFFAEDNQERRRAFVDESVRRHQELYDIVKDNVERGVELQSSAFWDIAPNLLDLLHRLSSAGEVTEWNRISIPDTEYMENPSYHEYPQQYVYTLLDHAEKSSYQFIEGQVNLHCLLHEVKSAQLLAECRKAEIGNNDQPGWERYRAKQEVALTGELKQKVAIIEEQWAEALGSALQGIKEQIKGWLTENGAWEEMQAEA